MFGFWIVFFVFVFFPSFASNRKTCFPLEKGIFCLCLIPLFLLSLFWPPPFSISLYLSLSLSLSLSCSFLLVFLLVFFVFFWFLVFLFFFSFSFFFACVSWKNNIKNIQLQLLLGQSFLFFFGFLSFVFFQIPLSYLCFFPDFKLCFCSSSMFLVSKNPSWKTPIFSQKGGCNKTGLFMNLCFAKCEKLSFFFASLWQIFGCSSKTL